MLSNENDALVLRTNSFKTIETGVTINDLVAFHKKSRNKSNKVVRLCIKVKLDEFTNITVYNRYLDTSHITFACETGFVCSFFDQFDNYILFEIDGICYKADEKRIRPDGFCGITIATDEDYKEVLKTHDVINTVSRIRTRSKYTNYPAIDLFKNTIKYKDAILC